MQEVYQLVVHYIDDDSGRWNSKHLGHSLSIEKLKEKVETDRPELWDELWYINEQEDWQLNTGKAYEEESFIISKIELI